MDCRGKTRRPLASPREAETGCAAWAGRKMEVLTCITNVFLFSGKPSKLICGKTWEISPTVGEEGGQELYRTFPKLKLGNEYRGGKGVEFFQHFQA